MGFLFQFYIIFPDDAHMPKSYIGRVTINCRETLRLAKTKAHRKRMEDVCRSFLSNTLYQSQFCLDIGRLNICRLLLISKLISTA